MKAPSCIVTAIAVLLSYATCVAQTVPRFHNETSDTLRIDNLLVKSAAISDPNERIASLANEFLGTPYVAGTLESNDGERLTINLDQFDCTTFVETVAALALTAGEGRTSWRDFIYNLEKLRYRNGMIDGYASRLHYFSDWVVDNRHRGNIEEVSASYPGASYEIRTLDFMSANRNLYPALTDANEYERIKSAELGYRSHRFPYIKTERIGKAAKNFLKEGDIVALVTRQKNLDVSHMGILVFNGDVPYLLHASSKEGKVIVDPQPLDRYLQRGRHAGIRVIRLKE